MNPGAGGLRHGVGGGAADEGQEGFQIGRRGAFGYGGLKARDLLVEVEHLGQDGRLLCEFLRTFHPPLPRHLPVDDIAEAVSPTIGV